MTDARVLFFDIPDFDRKYFLQVDLEFQTYRGFRELGARAPALATTLHSWIFRACLTMRGSADGSKTASVLDMYNQAIEALEWGYRTRQDVPNTEHRGIFQETFLRKLKCLRMECYVDMYYEDKTKYLLQHVYEEAKGILHELVSAAPPAENIAPSCKLAFYVYPRALANMTIAIYYYELADGARKDNDYESVKKYFCQAADYSAHAATDYPQDDEEHLGALVFLFEMMFFSGAHTVKDLLDVMHRVRLAMPKANKFWEGSSKIVQFRKNARDMQARSDKLVRAVRAGDLMMASKVAKPGVYPPDVYSPDLYL
ncbi:uncharacterized protein PHACADRAFT_203793 [Phanerochaete carnosa HHB-10118-sp]|uniref:Uncharacterized protein n=1 Tax=Phanerochaete carnosa (strain HHB-10118-sp) TaxID=650164 RepID=K5WMF7_PHACS|nr:uncharacterized protein PHACADRAFT_203793 [Phanerochaete carnosa HHB-10118-sp]EKM60630.1 hypothetical protein PHACADRAFT_203793 [Phanerochaete carnosa HHB-10118-sp]